jgi:hypothetical protein
MAVLFMAETSEPPPGSVSAKHTSLVPAATAGSHLSFCAVVSCRISACGVGRWAHRRHIVPPELIGRIAPTRLAGINLRGVFRFPVERYVGQLLPSQMAAKTSVSG